MTASAFQRGALAAAIAGMTVAGAAAHDTGAKERGRELFQRGMAQGAVATTQTENASPPLYAGLGSVSMTVTTANRAAQAYFDQGLRLTYAFNHQEAQRAFRKAQQLDPACAMCYWGEAYVLGPNINVPMDDKAVAPAAAAARVLWSSFARSTSIVRWLL